MLAREILAGKSSLYRESETNQIPESLPQMGRSKPIQAFKTPKVAAKADESSIGHNLIETKTNRIYKRCIATLGDVNFRLAYK